MMSSVSTTTTTDPRRDLRQALRGADPVTTEPRRIARELNSPEEDENASENAFLPPNHGVTGREPNTNPPDWLENHRRMPPHRPPVLHPEWVTIGGPLRMRIFLWNMFSGCQLLQWGYSVARGVGLHERGYCMYKVANEW